MRRALRRVRSLVRRIRRRERPVILMYHRVASPACDPWELAVQPAIFDAQIGALVNMRRVVPLGWLVRELERGRVPAGTAAVTFDDGYADVLGAARPVLDRHGCPATMFLTAGTIGGSEGFWWDELSETILRPETLPAVLEMEIAGSVRRWQLGAVALDAVAAARNDSASTRESLHLDLWKLLRPLSAAARRQHLDSLARWAGVRPQPGPRVLTAEEVRRLAEPGFIDIGAHSVTHPTMPSLDPAALNDEVRESKRLCEALAGGPVDGFAYPFGDHDEASVACVREAGFAFACSTQSGPLTDRSDPWRLPRFAVGNWPVERFTGWLGSAA
jgi:peptidoglycan/xylan/chitin deacetylase (PgdA/CDA1 family)